MHKSLTIIFILIGLDFLFCLIVTIIDTSNYKGNKILFFILNFVVFASLIGVTIFLLLKKRKKQVIAAGFLYLIGGVIIWLYKIIYFIYLLVAGKLDDKYVAAYTESIYLVSFLIGLIVIFFRLGTVYLIKLMFPDILKLEEYIHEKEHAELIQSLGNKGNDEDKLVEDDEITEESLYKRKNNPFITGREKKEENEEEEINFESTL